MLFVLIMQFGESLLFLLLNCWKMNLIKLKSKYQSNLTPLIYAFDLLPALQYENVYFSSQERGMKQRCDKLSS